MDNDDLLKRRQELFRPIDRQMMMTDDQNDMLLLASTMLESSVKIFINQYGVKQSKSLIDTVFKNIVTSLDSSTE